MKRNIYKINGYLILYCLICFIAISCEDTITDFGFDGSVSGILKDPSGRIVPGDLNSNNLIINALAEGDVIPIIIKVGGDGTFKNSKLYPVKTIISVSGPVFPVDPINVDLSEGKSFNQDIVVTPFITIDKPSIVGTPTSSSVDINFNITGNGGKVTSTRELYCSTSPYPTSNTGSGTYYTTIKVVLDSDNGTVSVPDLTGNTKYYLRIGAQAEGEGWNYSEQIIFNTP